MIAQGHMGFMEALAITQTPYPLPLAQLTNLFIMLFAVRFLKSLCSCSVVVLVPFKRK